MHADRSVSSVPKFKVYNDKDETVYIIHPPTCCGGTCIDFYAEGNPCPHGCCLIAEKYVSIPANHSREPGDEHPDEHKQSERRNRS